MSELSVVGSREGAAAVIVQACARQGALSIPDGAPKRSRFWPARSDPVLMLWRSDAAVCLHGVAVEASAR
eukprot:2058629-Pyramimonas_sp.AAC.1